MKMMRKLIAAALALTMLAALAPAASLASDNLIDVTSLYKSRDIDASWNDEEAVSVTLTGQDYTASDTADILLEGSTLTLRGLHTWVLSGEWNGSVVIEASESDKIHLVLNGVCIASPSGPAIYETVADKLIVTLAEDTVNTLTDATALTVENDEIAAAIYAEDDLSINGSGTLIVNAAAGHGIASHADLILASGTYQVSAAKDAVRGRNSVLVLDGSYDLNAEGDGIAATREEKEDKGWVLIVGGTLNITTGGGADSAETVSQQAAWGRRNNDWTAAIETEDKASSKGIKAETDLTIMGGTITLNSLDDGLHSDGNVVIAGGETSIASGDDGVHADTNLTISDGTLTVSRSSEGLEGRYIQLSGGTVSIVAADDGINATEGGNDTTGWGGMFAAQDCSISISGGLITVNASGDGIDSNGSISISGGEIYVSGPTNSGNAALDYNGSCQVTGGLLLAAGSAGMAQNVSSVTNQASLMVYLSGTQQGGSTITVRGEAGNAIISYTPDKAYQTVLITAPEMKSGMNITVECGGSEAFSGTLSEGINSNNAAGGFGAGGNWGSFGEGGGRGGRGWRHDATQTPPDGTDPERMTPPEGAPQMPRGPQGERTFPERQPDR